MAHRKSHEEVMAIVRGARLARVRRPRRLPDAPVDLSTQNMSEEEKMAAWREFRQNVVPNMMTSAELERARRLQERAWFKAGYSREDILTMLWNWPMSEGFPAYEWSVGYPNSTRR